MVDTAKLVTSGLFEVVETEGRTTLILARPVRLVVPTAVLTRLATVYLKNSEIGGFLYAEADTRSNTLFVREIVQLANLSASDRAFQPRTLDYNQAISVAMQRGLLPMRFHSHPVSTVNELYNQQSLNFFQKTSTADRHNSYLPIYAGTQPIVLPDCLISPNDRDGKTIRFSIYNGFIAPNSFGALLQNEQVFLGIVGVALLVVWSLWGWKRALSALVVCGLVGLFIFIREKRPTYQYNEQGLVITV
ncbi:hypothetical protein [Spirosoma areae]